MSRRVRSNSGSKAATTHIGLIGLGLMGHAFAQRLRAGSARAPRAANRALAVGTGACEVQGRR